MVMHRFVVDQEVIERPAPDRIIQDRGQLLAGAMRAAGNQRGCLLGFGQLA